MLFHILIGIALIATIVVVIGFWFFDDSYGHIGNGVVSLITIPFLGFVVSFGICLVVGLCAGTHEKNTERFDLQQISMSKDIHGSFFLGTGYIGNELNYYYYKALPDGSFKAETLSAEEASVKEDTQKPYIQKVTEYIPNWVMHGMDWDSRYVIHVPPGSVKPMTDVNLPSN